MLPEGVVIAHPEKLFIGGEWVSPAKGGTLEIVSPNTEQVVARTAEASEADMDAAVAAARQAFDHGPWSRMSPGERIATFRKMIEHMRPRADELARNAEAA